jgi:hypothetical protein
MSTDIWWGNPFGNAHFEERYMKIILRWVLEKLVVRTEVDESG